MKKDLSEISGWVGPTKKGMGVFGHCLDRVKMVRRLSKSEQDLIPSEVSVTSFDGGVSQTKGLISVDLTMGKTTKVRAFLVLLAYKYRAKEVAIRNGVGLKYLASKMAAAEKLIYLKKKDSTKYKANKNAQGKGGREKEK
ncbi:hypothetical protein PVK06_010476 [Gossypium arboreum]|uniref:Uncharacterized protein n=1 Tax=Gossypium arboreum TaxID=29729 RepID=A0ABR0Q6P4_GOSAR|nr:hypothetical protein PVK06_010476 [Gossypium arboreum]